MPSRRVVLAEIAALLATPPAFAGTAEERLLDRAIRRSGGRRRLAAIRLLEWEGSARIHDEARTIAIGVSTQVAPFAWARSRSWLVADGPDKSRTMTITPEGGWVERGGTSAPLDPRLVEHERAQFAIYGLMLLAPLLRPEARLELFPRLRNLDWLRVSLPGAPTANLGFDRSGRLAEAMDRVPAPDGPDEIEQRFVFSEESVGGEIYWPRHLLIEQRGKPYFELTLDRFAAR